MSQDPLTSTASAPAEASLGALVDDLRWKRLGDVQVRLEQERMASDGSRTPFAHWVSHNGLLMTKDGKMSTAQHAQPSATVSSKGQIVIPSAVRRRLNLVQGSVVRFVVEGDGVRLLAEAGDVRRLKGRLTPPSRPVSIEAMNKAIAARRAGIAAATEALRDRP